MQSVERTFLVKIMNQVIKRLLHFIIQPFFNFIFYIHLKFCRQKKLCIVDIDNTVADTWRALQNKSGSTKNVLKNLKAFTQMHAKVIEYENAGFSIVFLSVRNYSYYFVTKNWLIKNGFPVTFSNVIFVDKPQTKADLSVNMPINLK